MPHLIVEHPPGYGAERQYILDVILGEFLGLTYEARPVACDRVRISSPLGSGAVTLPDRLFQTPARSWLTLASLPKLPLRRVTLPGAPESEALPIIFGEDGPLLRRCDDEVALSVDVLGAAFFMLTRYEEAIANGPRDSRGRFPDTAALAIREGFSKRPIVNEYVNLLGCALRSLWPALPQADRSFRAWVTHDVDWPLATTGRNWPSVAYHVARDAIYRRRPEHALKRLRSYVRTRGGNPHPDMWNTFDFIMDTAERSGVPAAFYLIPERLAGKLDGSCAIDHPFMRRLIRRIDARGHEIGLHTSYQANCDTTMITRQLCQLRHVLTEEGVTQPILGGRQHYLRWSNPATWQGWSDAGLSYDSSLGWEQHTGFRTGTCYEYPVFNLRTRQRLPLRERTLVAMEEAAFIENGYQLERTAEGIIRLIRTIRKYNGDFVLLWHNNWLALDAERLCFRAVVSELSGGRGW